MLRRILDSLFDIGRNTDGRFQSLYFNSRLAGVWIERRASRLPFSQETDERTGARLVWWGHWHLIVGPGAQSV